MVFTGLIGVYFGALIFEKYHHLYTTYCLYKPSQQAPGRVRADMKTLPEDIYIYTPPATEDGLLWQCCLAWPAPCPSQHQHHHRHHPLCSPVHPSVCVTAPSHCLPIFSWPPYSPGVCVCVESLGFSTSKIMSSEISIFEASIRKKAFTSEIKKRWLERQEENNDKLREFMGYKVSKSWQIK